MRVVCDYLLLLARELGHRECVEVLLDRAAIQVMRVEALQELQGVIDHMKFKFKRSR